MPKPLRMFVASHQATPPRDGTGLVLVAPNLELARTSASELLRLMPSEVRVAALEDWSDDL